MKKLLLFVAFCLLGWGTADLLAQQGLVATGGVGTGSGGTVTFSVGQLDYLSATGTGGSINQGLQHPDGFHSISGTLTYDNIFGTPLSNTTVLLKQGNTVVSQVITDGAGFFEFINPEPGMYSLDAICTKPWGSVNATDAMLMVQHYAGLTVLSGLRLTAADVNGSGYVNATDALFATKRFVGLTNSFPTGDWVFEHPVLDYSDVANLTQDFKGICYGDVDGSYVPPFIKTEPTLFLENNGVQMIDNNQVVSIPIRVKQALNGAAVSLVLNFSSELEIVGVEAAYDNQTLVYNTIGNQLRIAWYTLDPKVLNADDVLMTLSLRLKTNASLSSDMAFELDAESSIADASGSTLLNKVLTMPVLVSDRLGFTLGQNIPNPFQQTTQFSYSLPEDGFITLELLDIVGKRIAVLEEKQQSSGVHTYSLSGNTLPDGVYFYRMTVSTQSQQYSQTKRMIISR